MMTNDDLSKIVLDCKEMGVDATLRDISFVLLCRFYEDSRVAYKVAFGVSGAVDDKEVNDCVRSRKMTIIKTYLVNAMPSSVDKKTKKQDDISFEENKAYMLELKSKTEEAMLNGEIDKKDALKILADLSVKLNDKFNVSDNTKEQIVVVNEKFNDICPVCQTEISRRPMSKEEAMVKYNLVEEK